MYEQGGSLMSHPAGVPSPTSGLQLLADGPVLLYDADCSVCRRFVALVIHADKRGQLRIAPLHSELGEQLRRVHPAFTARDSAVWVPVAGTAVGHSDAILAALAHVGGGWGLLAAGGRVVPRRLRDQAYRFFAGHRSWFAWLGLDQLDESARRRTVTKTREVQERSA